MKNQDYEHYEQRINMREHNPAKWVGWFLWRPCKNARASLGHIHYDCDHHEYDMFTKEYTLCGRKIPKHGYRDVGPMLGNDGYEIHTSKTWVDSYFLHEYEQCPKCVGIALQNNLIDLDKLI